MAKRGQRIGGFFFFLSLVFLVLLVFSLVLRYGEPLQENVDRWIAIGKSGDSKEEPLILPHDVGDRKLALRIQILNATRVQGLAARTGEILRVWGVDTLDRDNAPPWPFNETLLLLRRGKDDELKILSEWLGGVPVLTQKREDLMLDATLIMGHDWKRYKWPDSRQGR
ncbi:MAG: LytR C-terminal domain-containing protein [Candidatus Krumholzibacteria bacterium]|jgi:hypothetical protein|nr:LytR C-terminal domain-containing protein [Candidatus Krumholzibacteria bacterium]MDP6669215.1 LytR C-terminal domain-containing protein [Candidatus Krumholzibacteria bacterium]MDP6796458.1 LytR C-terminal domain-containing protein [Candidatus Krumholzibacteria bacterium]MDP7021588.1 LytR C-terminal domain-containing protein [Candidatus Krumholzibacteria bacterium]